MNTTSKSLLVRNDLLMVVQLNADDAAMAGRRIADDVGEVAV
jgi:hypothetical protein